MLVWGGIWFGELRRGGVHRNARGVGLPSPSHPLLEIAASRDSAPLQDSFPNRARSNDLSVHSSRIHHHTPSTHQHNCRHHFCVLLGISSISAYIIRLLCCVQPEVKIPHRTPAVTPSKGHRHLAPFARRQATALHRESTVVANPLYLPGGSAWAQGQRLLSPEKFLLDCEARVSWGVLQAKAAWTTPFAAFIHTSFRCREPSRTTALLLIRVKAAPPNSRKAWAGGILCRVHRLLPTQGFNFRHLLLS